jgi:hypothetical protein
MIKFIWLLFFPLSFLQLEPQYFFRISTDFVIKAKSPAGEQSLTVGRLFYDKNIKQIVYELSFPEKETWVQKDTTLYKIANSKITEKQQIPAGIDFSIYNLALNGNLADYGLKKTRFKITKVEKSDGAVLSTWEPTEESKKFLGDIIVSNTNQQLNGIVFKNSKGEVASRQFFRNYIKVKGLLFPMEVIKETYINGQKEYEITTFKNILINDLSGDSRYDYKIPSH